VPTNGFNCLRLRIGLRGQICVLVCVVTRPWVNWGEPSHG
jgi:hypothetical protein